MLFRYSPRGLLFSLLRYLGQAVKLEEGWGGYTWRKRNGRGFGGLRIFFKKFFFLFWGMAVPGCPTRGEPFSSLAAIGDWERKGSYHTAWSVRPLPRVLVRMRMDMAQPSGHKLVSGVDHCLSECGGLSHP